MRRRGAVGALVLLALLGPVVEEVPALLAQVVGAGSDEGAEAIAAVSSCAAETCGG